MKHKQYFLGVILMVLVTPAFSQQTHGSNHGSLSAEMQGIRRTQERLRSYQWASATYGGDHFGGLAVFSHDGGVTGIGAGPLFTFGSAAPRALAVQLGIAPGIDIGESNALNVNGFLYAEMQTNASSRNRKGMLVIQSYPYLSKEYGFWQMSSVMYSFTNTVSAGFSSQTEAITGIRVQYNLHPLNVSVTGGPKGVMVAAGLNVEF